jgi:hypothetical protein
MSKPIKLVCSACGNRMDYARKIDPTLPKNVVKIVANECCECNAANGGYGSEEWYDAAGNVVLPD